MPRVKSGAFSPMVTLDYLFVHSDLIFNQELLQTGDGLELLRPYPQAHRAFLRLSEYFNVALYFASEIAYPNLEKWAERNLSISNAVYGNTYKTGEIRVFGIIDSKEHNELVTYPYNNDWDAAANLAIAEAKQINP